MKTRLLIGVFVGLAAGWLQTMASTRGAAEQALLDLTRAWVDAETAQDEAMLRQVLDDQIVATFGSGAPIGKEAYVKLVMQMKPGSMTGHDLSDETVVVTGDTGIVVGTDVIHAQKDGVATATPYRYTATYIRRGERWTVLALHMVKIPPARK